MKGRRLQVAASLVAIASLMMYAHGAGAAGGVPAAPTGVVGHAENKSATVAWTPGSDNGSPILSFTVTPSPACGGCTGLVVTGATTSSTSVGGLTNGTPYTFTVHAHNANGDSVESGASSAVTPTSQSNGCKFDSFPNIPGGSSELAVGCTLTTATGGAGDNYVIEDLPQAQWHTGAGRIITTSATTVATSKTITASTGHFNGQDINNAVSGTGVPSNTFIVADTATSITLNHAVGSPGIPSGAKLTVDNSDGRTFTDASTPSTKTTGPNTKVQAVTTTVHANTASTATSLTVASTANFPSKGSLSIPTTTPTGTATFTYTGVSGGNKFTGLHKVTGSGTLSAGKTVTLTAIQSVSGLQGGVLHVLSTTGFSGSGRVTVPTTGPAGTVMLSYTGTTSNTFTGVAFVSGSAGVTNTAGSMAANAAVNQATDIASVPATLNVVSTANFPTSGTVKVTTTSAAGAVLNFTNITGTSLTGVTLASGTGFLSTGNIVSTNNASVIISPTAHFCAASLTPATCDVGGIQKTDLGKGISGTRLAHGTVITAVQNSTTVTISTPTVACPTGITTCNQIGVSSPAGITSNRQIEDATISGTSLTSNTANFGPTDVNLPVTCVGCTNIPANDYIAAYVSPTHVTMHVGGTAGSNKPVVIGAPNSSAPKNGDSVLSLSSSLSVSPSLASGVPDCGFDVASPSNLQGAWENPGSFKAGSFGQPGAVTDPKNGIYGPTGGILAQINLLTGPGNPSLAGYVVQSAANTPGDVDTAPHVDIVFPLLLQGVAVCPAPNDVGVASTFRFAGETLSQSIAGSGDVRELKDFAANTATATGTMHEHVKAVDFGLNTVSDLFVANGSCTMDYPTTLAGYGCGGN